MTIDLIFQVVIRSIYKARSYNTCSIILYRYIVLPVQGARVLLREKYICTCNYKWFKLFTKLSRVHQIPPKSSVNKHDWRWPNLLKCLRCSIRLFKWKEQDERKKQICQNECACFKIIQYNSWIYKIHCNCMFDASILSIHTL